MRRSDFGSCLALPCFAFLVLSQFSIPFLSQRFEAILCQRLVSAAYLLMAVFRVRDDILKDYVSGMACNVIIVLKLAYRCCLNSNSLRGSSQLIFVTY